MKSLSASHKIILLSFLLLVLLLVFITSWSSHKENTEFGPALIAEDSFGNVWIEVNSDIFILDGQGDLLNKMTAEQLEIQPPYTSIAPMPGGKMLVGSKSSGKIHVVNSDGTVSDIIDPANIGIGRLFGIFHLFFDETTNEIYVTDTSNHRILVLNSRGELLRQAGKADKKPGWLFFPNNILRDKQGRILIANTNQHKIYALSDSLEVIEEIDPVIRDFRGFVWPVFIGVDKEGHIYVTIHENGLRRGELVRLSADGKRELAYPLPEDTEPMSILARDRDVLLTDSTSRDVYSITEDNMTVSVFGGDEFRNILDESRDRSLTFGHIRKWSFRTLVAMLIFLFILLIIARKNMSGKSTEKYFERRAGDPEPSLFLRLEYVFIIALIILLPPIILLISLSLFIALFTHPFLTWIMAVFGAGIILSLLFTFSFLGSYIFAKSSRSGRYHSLLRSFDKKLLNRFSGIVVRLLRTNDKISSYAMGIVNGFPALVIMTGNKLIIASLNQLASRVMRIQMASSPSNATISVSGAYSGKWKWFLGSGFPTTRLSFNIGDASKKYSIDFLDHKAAEEIQKEIEAYSAVENMEGSTFRDYCVACKSDLATKNECPHCGKVSTSVWKPVSLSILFPGFGQLFNQELFKGILFMLTFSYIVINAMKPFFLYINKLATVNITSLVVPSILALLIWLLNMYDVLVTSRRSKFKRWGLKDS